MSGKLPRRTLLTGGLAAALLAGAARRGRAATKPTVTVHKSPT